MAALWKKLTTVADYPIVVAQYTRADYGAGQEENLHWALAVLLHEGQQKGPVYQAIDRHYSDGRGVDGGVWTGHKPKLSLKPLGRSMQFYA